MMNRLMPFLLLLCGFVATHAQTVLGDRHTIVHDIAVRDTLLGAATDTRVELWNLNTMRLISAMDYDGNDKFSAICFGINPDELITGTRRGAITLWKLNRKERSVISEGGNSATTTLDSNPARRLLAVGYSNRRLCIYDLESFRVAYMDSSYSSDVTVSRFSRDGKGLLSASGDGKINYYLINGFTPSVIALSGGWVWGLSERSDSAEVAIASDQSRISFIPMPGSSKAITPSYLHVGADPVTSIDHFTGNCVAYATLSGKVIIDTSVGSYQSRQHSLISQVRFVPSSSKFLKLAVATKGAGLVILDARNMNLHSLRSRNYKP